MSRLTAGMLEAGVIPGDLDAFKEEAGKIKLYFGGGGGGGPTQSTSYQTNIPEYAQPYASELFGKAQALTDTSQNPFPVYGGQRTADFSPLQQQAFQGIQGLGPSALNAPAAGMTGMAGLGGMGAGQQYQQMATDPGAIAAYMSPYMQNAVDWQKQQAIMDYGRQLPGQQAAATRSGAFGGSRQAIVESEAQRNLQNQLAGIQAQGTQAAFDQARQAQQYQANLGLQGLGLAGQMGAQLGQIGQTAFGQDLSALQAQQQAGMQQQQQAQTQLDTAYQQFLAQQQYPYQQLGFMSDILRGVPATTSAQQLYQAPATPVNQLASLGLGAYGINQLFGGKKKGGVIKNYKKGGVVKASGAGLGELAIHVAMGGE
jgi:hypothetical protein